MHPNNYCSFKLLFEYNVLEYFPNCQFALSYIKYSICWASASKYAVATVPSNSAPNTTKLVLITVPGGATSCKLILVPWQLLGQSVSTKDRHAGQVKPNYRYSPTTEDVSRDATPCTCSTMGSKYHNMYTVDSCQVYTV